jgi:DNA-binding MarR family transcriptional regulator
MAAADWDEFPNPTLMRSARGVYAQSIRAHLAALGIDDLPRNGAFVLAGIGASGGPGQDLPAGLGVSKQAVSQVIEILVNRGYLTRRTDPGDRRRVVLELTGSGQEVVAAIGRGVDSVDHRLAERVSTDQIEAMRSALIALTEIKADAVGTGAGRRRSPGQLRSFSPIFPVRDLGAALAHYAALGFDTRAYDGGAEYGFADRDGVGLHLAAGSGGDGAHPGAAYLYVRDADALYL